MNLTKAEQRMLNYIKTNMTKETTMSQMAKELSMTRQNISAYLKRLEDKKLIKRKPTNIGHTIKLIKEA